MHLETEETGHVPGALCYSPQQEDHVQNGTGFRMRPHPQKETPPEWAKAEPRPAWTAGFCANLLIRHPSVVEDRQGSRVLMMNYKRYDYPKEGTRADSFIPTLAVDPFP